MNYFLIATLVAIFAQLFAAIYVARKFVDWWYTTKFGMTHRVLNAVAYPFLLVGMSVLLSVVFHYEIGFMAPLFR